MAEVITEEQPRIKYSTIFDGALPPPPPSALPPLRRLAALMARMEALGAAPILNDGQVAGNCAISPRALLPPPAPPPTASPASPASAAPEAEASPSPYDGGLALVSMSGKPPGHTLDPYDFVLVTGFDTSAWAATYRSRGAPTRPSSDSPLLVAALARAAEWGWGEAPAVVLHGHALAEGEGLDYAASRGIPISPRATLFSTPEDLAELEALFRSHPYPGNACYIRRGHGFFLLAPSVEEAEARFDALVVPWLQRQAGEGPQA
ncbi:hypothetical protein HYH03_013392 [Edaphochlamys debaryana]|uniref:Uncharacterized protein n=1 Tax=Edaphochlamys debaryana TaxID=47281 RepID=A0A835XYP4_9CHLO|nr:hypothetical protein HYH03_013392 [Edaphochlamys debaryana]|eukprot:KAG2488089.1 hypothetical protein HYH03_013392 [Edaphochlamys debaryana]